MKRLPVLIVVFAISSLSATLFGALSFDLTIDYVLSPDTSPTVSAPASDITVDSAVSLCLSVLWDVDSKMRTGVGVAVGSWPMQIDGASQPKTLLDVFLAVSEYRVELRKGIYFFLSGRGGFSSYDFKEWATSVKVLAGASFNLRNLEFNFFVGMESRYFSLSQFLYSGYPIGMSLKLVF